MKRIALMPGQVMKGIKYLGESSDTHGTTRRYCFFECHCGKQFEARIDSVTLAGHGCGCSINIPRHGYAKKGNQHHLYGIWNSMRTRCENPKAHAYPSYGGRGIKVCERWHDFMNFLEDMGEPSKGMSLDRIDNDGNYEPDNCRWASTSEQQRNTRRNHFLEFKGERKTVAEWANIVGLTGATIYKRLKRGWTIEDALCIETKR